ncbi:MAG: hypothetical protein RLZZ546_2952 [Bacteroidota bacterium]|jgi:undecaprenyl-diphosphatase
MKIYFLFVFTCLLSINSNGQNFDIDLLENINLKRNKAFDGEMKFVSNSVLPLTVGTPIILLTSGWISKNKENRQKGLYVLGSAASCILINTGLKYAIGRKRPYISHPTIDNVVMENTPSFPSGHTSTSFNLAASMSLIYPKWYVAVPSFLWAGTAAYSRMHLGAHYPIDVFGGIVVGIGSAYLSHYLHKKYFTKK